MADATLTPQQAAQALADIAGYEEVLNARTGALTGMIFGLVTAGIFVSYGLAAPAGATPEWVLAFLWLPWTLAGIATTMCVSHLLSLSRSRPARPRIALAWAGVITLVFVVAIFLLHLLHLESGVFPYMMVVNAIVALGIMARVSVERRRATALPLAFAAAAMLLGAFAVGAGGLAPAMQAFAAAGVCGGGFVLAGLAGFVRG